MLFTNKKTFVAIIIAMVCFAVSFSACEEENQSVEDLIQAGELANQLGIAAYRLEVTEGSFGVDLITDDGAVIGSVVGPDAAGSNLRFERNGHSTEIQISDEQVEVLYDGKSVDFYSPADGEAFEPLNAGSDVSTDFEILSAVMDDSSLQNAIADNSGELNNTDVKRGWLQEKFCAMMAAGCSGGSDAACAAWAIGLCFLI